MEGLAEGIQALTATLSRKREDDVLHQLRPKSYVEWNSRYADLNFSKYTADFAYSGNLYPLYNLRISKHLDELSKLRANWDGYGAVSPSLVIVEKIRSFISIIPMHFLSSLDVNNIYPNPNGTITIEWRFNDNLASLEFGIDTANYFTRINSTYAGEENLQGLEKTIPLSVIQSIESIFS